MQSFLLYAAMCIRGKRVRGYSRNESVRQAGSREKGREKKAENLLHIVRDACIIHLAVAVNDTNERKWWNWQTR